MYVTYNQTSIHFRRFYVTFILFPTVELLIDDDEDDEDDVGDGNSDGGDNGDGDGGDNDDDDYDADHCLHLELQIG